MSEYRYLTTEVTAEGNTVTGMAIVYDRESQPMPTGKSGARFVEVIKPGAARDAIRGDTLALYNHQSGSLLGRTTSGTLQLTESAEGVRYTINLPDTQLGRDVREYVKRGDIRGASFHIDVPKGGDKWTRNKDGMLLREVSKLGSLPEVSLVASPAYADTTAALRSLEEWEKEHGVVPMSLRVMQARLANL